MTRSRPASQPDSPGPWSSTLSSHRLQQLVLDETSRSAGCCRAALRGARPLLRFTDEGHPLTQMQKKGPTGPEILELGKSYQIDGRALAVLEDGRLAACVTSQPDPPGVPERMAGEILIIDPLAVAGAEIVNRFTLGVEFQSRSCQLVKTPMGLAATWRNYSSVQGKRFAMAALLSSSDGSLVVGPTAFGSFVFPPERWVYNQGYLYGASRIGGGFPSEGAILIRVNATTLIADPLYRVPIPVNDYIATILTVTDGTSLFVANLKTGSGWWVSGVMRGTCSWVPSNGDR